MGITIKDLRDDEKRKLCYNAFTRNGDIGKFEKDDQILKGTIEIDDVLSSGDLTRFIPETINTVIQESLEPNLLVTKNLFQKVRIDKGVTIRLGAIGAMTASIIPQGQEYPQALPQYGEGNMITVTTQKHGMKLSLTEEAADQYDIIGLWLREAGRAMARHKEKLSAKMLCEAGDVVFNNADPANSARGLATGRGISGAQNGSMTITDLLDMYAYGLMRGFQPDTLMLHPLSWSLFASDPETREIIIEGLAQRRIPNGQPSQGWDTPFNGLGYRTKATGTGTPDDLLGKIGANPWTQELNPLGATFQIAPRGMPGSLNMLITPHVKYTPSGVSFSGGASGTGMSDTDDLTRYIEGKPTVEVVMADSRRAGLHITKEDVNTGRWEDPETDIQNIKVREKYGNTLMEQGKGVWLASDIVLAKNYVFENVNQAKVLPLDRGKTSGGTFA